MCINYMNKEKNGIKKKQKNTTRKVIKKLVAATKLKKKLYPHFVQLQNEPTKENSDILGTYPIKPQEVKLRKVVKSI